MRRTYKPLFWQAARPVNSTDCMIEGRYCLKRIIIDISILYFIKYFHSFIEWHRVYGTCGPPKQRLVRSAHDCETGLFKSPERAWSRGVLGQGKRGKAIFTIMRTKYKRFVWRATRPVNTADCMDEGTYC